MPLKIETLRGDDTVAGDEIYVFPGTHGSFLDYSSGKLRIVSMFCREDDSGADIYIFDAEDLEIEASHVEIPGEWYTVENLIVRLEDEQSHEQRVIDEDGTLGRLALYHFTGIPHLLCQN